jgi:hypothetical protein
MSDENRALLRHQFNRRFALGLHAAVSGVISLILLMLVFTHPLNTLIQNNQVVWAGYARPDLLYLASILIGAVGLHGLVLLWHEGRLLRRRFGFALHGLLTLVSVALTLSYLSSWYFNEAYKWVEAYVPASPGAPPAPLINLVLLLTVLLTITLPLHGIGLLYRELLSRSLDRAQAKPKRDETLPLLGDDGEIPEWVEEQLKAKHSR